MGERSTKKNQPVAKLFKEIGWVDELVGSGVRNVHKYSGLYTPGSIPVFTESDVFELIYSNQVKKFGENQRPDY